MKLQILILILSSLLFAGTAQALLGTSTLPSGINSPSFRFGVVDKIGEKYTGDGTLMKLGDLKSIEFDAATLKEMSPDAQKLIDALNSFGDHRLGDQFNFGVLRIHTLPQVNYFAPVFARGLSEKWTLGLGLPVVTYKNKIAVTQDYSNIDYYREQFAGLSPALDEALNMDLLKVTNQTLAEKGYRPLNDRDETFLGDAQIASIYKFFEDDRNTFLLQTMVYLPTGPRYDPDDLAALNIFGRTSIANTFAYSHRVTSRFSLLPYYSYYANLPDRIVARVPATSEDTLPDATSKEEVRRQLGNTHIFGGNAFYEVNDNWVLGSSYEYATKAADRFAGGRERRYDMLSTATETQTHRVKGEITYTSVKSYFNKTALLPMMVSLEVSDTIAGLNVERQLVQELNMMLFF